MRRVERWFLDQHAVAPPESVGFWGDLCDEFYRHEQGNEKAKNRLQADIAYLKDSLTSLSDAIVMVDKSGCIDWCNEASRHVLGLQFQKDYGQPLTHLFRDPEFIRFFDSGNYSRAIKINSPSDPNKHIKVQISTFGKGDRLVFARDITEISELEKVRQDFVSNVSHELRTPLTVITGYIDNFHVFTDKLPVMEKPLNQMAQQAFRMEQLIKDLLDLSRLETLPNEMHKTSVNLSQLAHIVVDEAKASLQADKKHRHIELKIDDDVCIFGRQTELHSALLNLVINACKYTHEDGRIEVSCWRDERGGYFTVKDNGVGIDPIQIPRLTERFYRVDKSRSINTGGTGLGLAIVKRVLIRHEATIDIQSQLGKGSLFSCHFPLYRMNQAGEKARLVASSNQED